MRVFFLALMIFVSAVAARADGGQPMRLPVDSEPLTFVTANGNKLSFALEVADTEEERMRGLMFRRDFPKERAMLFVFGETRRVSMWMENTPLPLDMVFLDEKGRVSSIHENATPFSQNIISSGPPAAYVVELLAGTVKRTGIHRGDRAIHRTICGKCRP